MLMRETNDGDVHLSETKCTWQNFHRANNHLQIRAGSDTVVHTKLLTGHVPAYTERQSAPLITLSFLFGFANPRSRRL